MDADRLNFSLDNLEKMSIKEDLTGAAEITSLEKEDKICKDESYADTDFESMDLLGDESGFSMDTVGNNQGRCPLPIYDYVINKRG